MAGIYISATFKPAAVASVVPAKVLDPPPPEAVEFIVIESFVALVVNVILLPAINVSVSLVLSAVTVDCPSTAILPNKFCEPPPPPNLRD